ncbi:hypothetical protein C8J57DRAFT_1226230 [Mycena rebaudengoi]|nr:hypothetical protein C8J57DRAFT_1226230 [Mycena rebaudengoi]
MRDVGRGKQVVFERFRSAADGWRAVLAHLVGILGARAEPETGGEMPSPPEEVEGEIFGKIGTYVQSKACWTDRPVHGEVLLDLPCPMHDHGARKASSIRALIGKTGTDVVECAFDRRRMDGVLLAHLVGIRGARAEPETAIASNGQQRMYYA